MAAMKGTRALMRSTVAAAAFLTAFAVFSSLQVSASASPGPKVSGENDREVGRIMVSWEEGAVARVLSYLTGTGGAAEQALKRCPGLLERISEGGWVAPGLQAIELPQGVTLVQAKEVLESLSGVRYVEEDAVVSADAVPNDPYYSRQWHLPRIGAERAWEVSRGDAEITVAVVDTGVDPSHPELAGRVLAGYDFVGEDDDPGDENGHGTYVAGIVAAAGDNGQGVAGVAWRVRVLPVRVLDANGQGFYSDVVAGIRYAADRGARIINLSLGGGAYSRALQEAVDHARARGSLPVAAAGNSAAPSLDYPAACQGVVGVGATDGNDLLASFSNHGEDLDIVAPGVSIYSTYPGGRYVSMNGTSAAAPQVAGAAALLLSVRGSLSAAEAEQRLLSTARNLGEPGRDNVTGWGLVQLDKAMGWQGEETDGGENGEASGDRWYFAEGYTGPGFDTYITVVNPAAEACETQLELFGPRGPLYMQREVIPPHTRATFHVNSLVAPGDVAAKVSLPAGSPVRVQRSMYFDYRGIRDGHTCAASRASTRWYFAEGYTGPGFDTYLLVLNPESREAQVRMELALPSGVRILDIPVPPLTRRTVRLNDVVPGAEVSAFFSSDVPVVAERAMYFDCQGRKGGSVAAGASATSQGWYFAEGYTGGEFDQWLLLSNPSSATVTARASFHRRDGQVVHRDITLRPRSRATLHVDEIPGLEEAEVSTSISAAAPGVVAERAMYFWYTGSMGRVDGGHAAMGAAAPASRWYLPEGYTGPGFESWLLVDNLEDVEVTVRISLYGEKGSVVMREWRVGPHSRFTVKENDLLSGQGVSAEVQAPEGVRLVVEGAYYFLFQGKIGGGSC